jgi:hypothetical protein
MHRAKRLAPRECGWKHGDSGYSADKKHVHKKPRIDLTPTGLLMEGAYTTLPRLFAPSPGILSVTAMFRQLLRPTSRNCDEKAAIYTKRMLMPGSKLELVTWLKVPAESVLVGWPKHEIRYDFDSG